MKISKVRFYIQLLFSLITITIGIRFYLFVTSLTTDGEIYARPASVEAFLPISSLMSLYYFFLTGVLHTVHPAGLVIFVAILAVSFIFGKSFCSWICPVGFISELVGDFGKSIKINIQFPKFLDIPLRGVKYLLLGFFVYVIFFSMGDIALKSFLDTDYNKIADVKMYYFFAEASRTTLYVLTFLVLVSILVKHFWCRYLCPYGALIGIIGLFSPNKITRNKESCISCGLCAKTCPSKIKVDKRTLVISDECTSCLSCVEACPVKDTLEYKTVTTNNNRIPKYIGAAILIIYFSLVGTAMVTGYWKTSVSENEYKTLIKNINSLDHPKTADEMRKY